MEHHDLRRLMGPNSEALLFFPAQEKKKKKDDVDGNS